MWASFAPLTNRSAAYVSQQLARRLDETSHSQHRLESDRDSRIQHDPFLFEPHRTRRQPLHQVGRCSEIEVIRPYASQSIHLDELLPERRNKPAKVRPNSAKVLNNPDTIRVEVAEMNDMDGNQVL